MKKCNNKQMKNAYYIYNNYKHKTLFQAYNNPSWQKQKAMGYCREICAKYNGDCDTISIIGYNTFSFSVGFIAYVDGKKAFFFITKDYDRYMYID